MALMDRLRRVGARIKAFGLSSLRGPVVFAFALTSQAMAETIEIEAMVAAAGGDIENTTVVIQRLSDGQQWIANPDRAHQRYSPASTSKIAHSLIALENGVATPTTVFEWDGVPRSNRAWNKDHTLETAFQNSAVWVYQRIAQTAGQKVMSDGLTRFEYGNADVGSIDQLTSYWLDDTLKISALEQVEFLSRLAREHLPLSAATYATAKDIMVSEQRDNWTMRSKTGWRYSKTDMDIGWFVGWLDCADETYVLALNMDMPDTRYLSKRKIVTYSVLTDIGAFDCR